MGVMSKIRGVQDLGIFRVIGQPNLNLTVNRDKAARFGINVSDVQDAIETATGGKAVSSVLKGEERYDLVVRYQPQYRTHRRADRGYTAAGPVGRAGIHRPALRRRRSRMALRRSTARGTQRYVAIKYGVRGRDLGSTVEEAIGSVTKSRQAAAGLPAGVGRRIRIAEALAEAAGVDHSAHAAGDLPDSVFHVLPP